MWQGRTALAGNAVLDASAGARPRRPCHIGLRPLFGKWDGSCHCRAILAHGISKHAGELGRAKKLREKRIGNDVLSFSLLDMTVFHQLALGGIYSRRDSERMTLSKPSFGNHSCCREIKYLLTKLFVTKNFVLTGLTGLS